MSVSIQRYTDGTRGFTLLEVLVTIALIALLTGVLVVGTSRLLGDRPKTPDELFWLAAAAARNEALLHNHSVRLSLDTKSCEFILASAAAETRMPFVPAQLAAIDFLPPKSPSTYSAILIAGELVETRNHPFVTFYSDGTCSPFRVQLKGRTQTRVLEIDPWTCAPMLAPQADR